MKIILANPRGFCAGVNMAIESLERALQLFGNSFVCLSRDRPQPPGRRSLPPARRDFRQPHRRYSRGGNGVVQRHGVAPAIRTATARRRLRAIDATCPLVTKVHLEAVRFAREGYTILLIGHQGHDEVVGTMGEAPSNICLVQDLDDVARLDVPAGTRLAFLTQTTLSVDDATVLITALKQRFPQIVGPSRDDICYATQNRQEAVKDLMPTVDAVLVLGSQNSSNSKRLEEIARSCGKPAYLIDGADEIGPNWFTGDETLLVTAGASAPEDVVQQCVAYLQTRYGATVESRPVREEHTCFPLPRELRPLAL